MSFSFGFSGDDIEPDQDDVAPVPGVRNEQRRDENATQVPAKAHELAELLSTLPDKLSYSILTITSPSGKSIRLPRRELFDIRMQLMAEDEDLDSNSSNANQEDKSTKDLLAGLDDSDIRTNVYEGGFKSWECSVDLVRYLLDRGPRKDLDDLWRVGSVVEMGCGTALPSLTLFSYALTNSIPISFTLTDYNASVLRLVTIPNLLLTWASTLPATASPFSEESPNPLATSSSSKVAPEDEAGYLEITPELITAFQDSLRATPIPITLISGSWSPSASSSSPPSTSSTSSPSSPSPYLSLIPSPDSPTLILASETIYSPSALTSFAAALIDLLKRSKMSKALVAAKRVYFGVGGSVDGFKEEVSVQGAVSWEVDFEGLEDGGVRRCIVEVQMC